MASRVSHLDGVRGACVISVMLFHYTLFPAGWLAVPIFFILSGYLVSKKLIALKGSDYREILREHYIPRISRLVPLYVLLILLMSAIFLLSGWPEELRSTIPYLLSFSFNVYPLVTSDEAPHVLCHLWSLAMEMQFYLIIPIIIRFLPLRSVHYMALALLLFAPLSRAALAAYLQGVVSSDLISRSIYYFPLSHVDAFGVGIALAWADTGVGRPEKQRALAITLVVVTVTVAALTYWSAMNAGASSTYEALSIRYPEGLHSEGKHVFYLTFIAALGGLITQAVITRVPVISALFSSRVLQRLGVLCFGLYMLHLPLLEGVRYVTGIQPRTGEGLLLLPVFFLVCYILAEASYRFFELRWYRPSSPR